MQCNTRVVAADDSFPDRTCKGRCDDFGDVVEIRLSANGEEKVYPPAEEPPVKAGRFRALGACLLLAGCGDGSDADDVLTSLTATASGGGVIIDMASEYAFLFAAPGPTPSFGCGYARSKNR